MYNHDGSHRRCDYCNTTMYRKASACRRCETAEKTARRAWPDKELTPDLIERVRVQLVENNDLGAWSGWPPSKKLKYEILREQKKLLQDRFVGKRAAWKHGHHEGEDVVRDVKIHHGQIFYHFEGRSEGVKRARLDSWEVQSD